MNSQVEEIKNRLDLAEVIQEYIKLTPAGVDNFKAKCPFHNEKTPSFMVSRDKQIWHCFGCGEGGDVFTWLQKMEGIDFPEALRILAKRANVTLEYQSPEMSNEKTRLFDICKQAADYWHDLLLTDPAAEFVREYLRGRKFQAESITEWQLGWARDSWDDLLKHLRSLGYKDEEVFAAGLAVKSDKDRSYYDRFRNRLTFPINNHHGQVVGFSARTMAGEEAKYINTPQTLIYNKSFILYGIHKAKSFIKKQDYAILVEGNADVIAVFQAGTKNVVGVSGTALTLEQINILKRYSNNVMISFDADSAGQKAALRGLDLAWQQGMNVKVIKLQAGKDPAECLEKDKGLWLQSIKGAVNIIDYYFESVLRDLDLNRSDHKKKAAASLLPIIARLPDAIDRTHYLQKLGHILGVDDKVLADKINALKPKVATVTAVPVSSGQSVNSREITVLLGERILALLLSHPEKISLIINELLPEDFVDSNFQNIYKELNIYYTKGNLHDLDRTTAQQHVLGLWDDKKDLLPIVNTLSLLASKDFHALTDREIERELEQLVKRFKKENIQLRVKKLSEALAQAEAKGEVARVEELTAQLDQEIINLS